VGSSTAATLIANAVAPGLLDRYLARTGYTSQQTGEPQTSHDPANLWTPADADADFGAHGHFDGQATRTDPQIWASEHHGVLAAAAAAVAGTALWRWRR
jgi:hypothetical protein